MKKIRFYFARQKLADQELSVKLQGFLMSLISSDYATFLHQQETNPYSTNLLSQGEESVWTVNLVTQEAEQQFLPLLEGLTEIELRSYPQKIVIERRVIEDYSLEDLFSLFREPVSDTTFHLVLDSPTSFRSQGQYVLFPDLRLLLQSLMQKYSRLIDEQEEIDEDLLSYLTEKTQLCSYRLQTHYFSIHRQKIPAFRGSLTIRFRGAHTAAAYLSMLLRFGEFAGLGIKTSLGMGGMHLEDRKSSSFL